MTAHASYYNDVLGNLYCRDCGTEWPCLPVRQEWEARQDRAIRCLCSHIDVQHREDGCVIVACGCRAMRPKRVSA